MLQRDGFLNYYHEEISTSLNKHKTVKNRKYLNIKSILWI